jgi:periplasmic protein TonB
MALTKRFGGVLVGTLASGLLHLGAGGGVYYWFVKREPPPIVAELDLSMTPLVPVLPNAGGGSGAKQPDPWVVSKKKVPLQTPAKIETKEEVAKTESQPAPCEGPNCPDGPVIGQGWGGGNGEGDGQFVPVEQTSRKPRWIKNFITSADYPLIARQEGRDGRVVLTVFIDADGKVRGARLLQGSYEVLNEVALRKVSEAIFSPAFDENGKPVSCKVTLPIRFRLQ